MASTTLASNNSTASQQSLNTTTLTSSKFVGNGGGGGLRSNLTNGMPPVKCAKFVPQAFNTNKCQQCFNMKDVHSTDALAEFSKVSCDIYIYSIRATPCIQESSKEERERESSFSAPYNVSFYRLRLQTISIALLSGRSDQIGITFYLFPFSPI